MSFSIHTIFKQISPRFRRRRMAEFQARIGSLEGAKVLDCGGYPACWTDLDPVWDKIIVSNIDEMNIGSSEFAKYKIEFAADDGCNLPYEDKEFDIVFSNSVIEHVGDWEAQKRFAKEMLRVGKKIWIQTPAKEFFIEPHYITPFIHWIRPDLRRKLIRNFTVWGWVVRPDEERVEKMMGSIRLISKKEMLALFPRQPIYNERFAGVMVKSYTAFGDAAKD